MLEITTTAEEKRKKLRKKLKTGKLLSFPGAFIPLVAKQIEALKFSGVYVSGAAFSASLGLPDIGLTTLSEVANLGKQISSATSLPCIIDADTGFAGAINVSRCVREMEIAGLAGLHLEDQVNPKRCGHLDGKELVSTEEMIKKISLAVKAKTDENFLIIARTDARGPLGLEEAIKRAKAYVDAGAEMIFPEALESEKEFEIFRKEISVPLMANMTEFGKSKLLSKTELENLGYNIVIYPATTLRLSMKAVEDGLKKIKEIGSQISLLERMQTRAELYELLDYDYYKKL